MIGLDVLPLEQKLWHLLHIYIERENVSNQHKA